MTGDGARKPVASGKQDRSNAKTLLWRIGSGLLLVVAGAIAGQIFLPRQERLALRRATAESQYRVLQQIRLFSELGAQLHTYVFVTITVGPDSRALGADTTTLDVPVPGIVGDSAMRQEWLSMRREIGQASETIDPRVFDAFVRLGSFADSLGWPKRNELASIERTGWTRPEILGRWLTLNRVLSARADAVLNLKM